MEEVAFIADELGIYFQNMSFGNSQWDCECVVCGNHITISTYWFNKSIKLLEKGFNREGCKYVKPVKIGDSFGFLSVVEQDSDYIKPKSGSHEKRWICQCTCGRKKTILVIDKWYAHDRTYKATD